MNHGVYVTIDGLRRRKKNEEDIGEKARREYMEKNYTPLVSSDGYYLVTSDGYQLMVRKRPMKYEKGET